MTARVFSRKAYLFQRGLDRLSPQMRKDRPIAELRRIAKRIWTAEGGAEDRIPLVVAGAGWRLKRWGLCSYYDNSSHRIVLARDMRCLSTLIHELAHALGPFDKMHHGPAFCARNFDLLVKYGRESPATLLAAAIHARL